MLSIRFHFISAMLISLPLWACGGNGAPPPEPARMDSDGDGIADSVDLCPEQREDFNGYQDDDGCPDSSTAHDPFPDALVGEWSGALSLRVGGSTFSGPHSVSIVSAPDHMSATLTGVCPGGSGSIEVVWQNSIASWYGIYLCPSVAWGGCPRAVLIEYGVRGTLSGDGALQVTGTGTARLDDLDDGVASNCDVSGEVVAEFSGTRH